MRKSLLLLLFTALILVSKSSKSQQLYSNTALTSYIDAATTFAFAGSNKAIVADDIEIPNSLLGTNDSVNITKVKFGIYRPANAPAATFTLCYSPLNPSGTGANTDTSWYTVPPTEFGTVSLTANGSSAKIVIISFGDSVNTLIGFKLPTTEILTGSKAFFLGIKFSTAAGTNAWIISNPTTAQNINRLWIYNPDIPKRFSVGFGGTNPPYGAMYVQVFGKLTTVLPVNYLSFDGAIQNNHANLKWSTANESNNKGFDVERSIDGQHFSAIGFVAGHGSSANVNNYSYNDNSKLLSSNIYYRLKQTDLDGKYTYSKTIHLTQENKFGWIVYPNPAVTDTWLTLNLPNNAKVTVQVASANGKILQAVDKGTLTPGTYSLPLSLNNVAHGTYFVKLIVDNKTYTQTIIK